MLATFDTAGFEERTVESGNVRLRCVTAGPADGPLALFLHGFPARWSTWRGLLPAFARAGYLAVAPDLRGYGASDRPADVESYSLLRILEDVVAILDAFGRQRSFVVGHDVGGGVAWAMAMAHPERVERLAILNSVHVVGFERQIRKWSQLSKSWYVFFFLLPWLPEWWLSRRDFGFVHRSLVADGLPDDVVRDLMEGIRPAGALHAALNWYRANFRDVARKRFPAKKVDLPTLVVWGDREKHLDPELATPPADWVSDVRVEHVPEAGHWAQHDAPEKVSSTAAFPRRLATHRRSSLRNRHVATLSETRMMVNWKRVAIFYGATFALTHVLSLGYVLSGGSWSSPSSFAVANALMLCPALVALGLQRYVFREPIVAPLGLNFRPNRWFVLSWLLPPVVMVGALAFSLLLPGARYSAEMDGLPGEMASFKRQVLSMGLPPLAGMLLIGLALGPTLNAIGGLGEEMGWRGFLYKELTSLGFWQCSLVTGALWALWHVPLLFEGYPDPQHPVAGGVGVIAFAVLLAPILHFVRWRSGSVVACGILHGTMSSTRLISVAFVRDAGPWANAAIPLALLVANAALLAIRRRDPSAPLSTCAAPIDDARSFDA